LKKNTKIYSKVWFNTPERCAKLDPSNKKKILTTTDTKEHKGKSCFSLLTHVTQPGKFKRLTTNHTKNTNFLAEILFFIRAVGEVSEGRPSVCRGKFSFHFQVVYPLRTPLEQEGGVFFGAAVHKFLVCLTKNTDGRFDDPQPQVHYQLPVVSPKPPTSS
jgi:hypothetical protein